MCFTNCIICIAVERSRHAQVVCTITMSTSSCSNAAAASSQDTDQTDLIAPPTFPSRPIPLPADFTLLEVGRCGSGKTMLMHTMIQSGRWTAVFAFVSCPNHLTAYQQLHVPSHTSMHVCKLDTPEQLTALTRYPFRYRNSNGPTTLVIVEDVVQNPHCASHNRDMHWELGKLIVSAHRYNLCLAVTTTSITRIPCLSKFKLVCLEAESQFATRERLLRHLQLASGAEGDTKGDTEGDAISTSADKIDYAWNRFYTDAVTSHRQTHQPTSAGFHQDMDRLELYQKLVFDRVTKQKYIHCPQQQLEPSALVDARITHMSPGAAPVDSHNNDNDNDNNSDAWSTSKWMTCIVQ
jgi:hypothetical protein